jgi:hypothetical protein
MNVILKSTDLTEDGFRSNNQLRGPAQTFFESEAGAALLYLLKEKAKFKSKGVAVPAEAISNYSIAELSRLSGVQEAIDLITTLCVMPKPPKQVRSMPQLGSESEENLPPKFELNKQPPATTQS